MEKKELIVISILQILVGVLAAIVFVSNIVNKGETVTTIMVFFLMLLGGINGVRGIYEAWRE